MPRQTKAASRRERSSMCEYNRCLRVGTAVRFAYDVDGCLSPADHATPRMLSSCDEMPPTSLLGASARQSEQALTHTDAKRQRCSVPGIPSKAQHTACSMPTAAQVRARSAVGPVGGEQGPLGGGRRSDPLGAVRRFFWVALAERPFCITFRKSKKVYRTSVGRMVANRLVVRDK